MGPCVSQVVHVLTIIIVVDYVTMIIPCLAGVVVSDTVPSGGLALLNRLAKLVTMLVIVCRFKLHCHAIRVAHINRLVLGSVHHSVFARVRALPFDCFSSHPRNGVLVHIIGCIGALSSALDSNLVGIVSSMFAFLVALIIVFIIS